MAIQPEISRVKESHKEALMAKPNVIGVGTGYKVSDGERTEELCLVTLVRQKVPPSALQADAMVPKSIEGVRTDVIEIGDVRALQTRTSRWRPAPAGVSLGHYRITAGTFGCLVRDRASGAPLMLSNNHVLANSNDATVGDAILQPGPADGGRLGRGYDRPAGALLPDRVQHTTGKLQRGGGVRQPGQHHRPAARIAAPGGEHQGQPAGG